MSAVQRASSTASWWTACAACPSTSRSAPRRAAAVSSGAGSCSAGSPEVAEAPRLSIVVPFYNDADHGEPRHRQTHAVGSELPGGVEFVYVDDGSADGTRERLLALAKRDPRIRVLRLEPDPGESGPAQVGLPSPRARA